MQSSQSQVGKDHNVEVSLIMDEASIPNNNIHMLRFSLKSSPASINSPRLGKLSVAGRKSFDTPHYVAATSRGIVPHIAQNTMRKNMQIESVYMGLEDCE